jgi:hypothetical protein
MSWLLLNQALLELTAASAHADAIERLLWNHLFAAQTVDGDGFRYFCSLNGYKPLAYYTGPDCCSASGARVLAMLPGTIYAVAKDAVYVNQYVESAGRIKLGDNAITIRQTTRYPESERIVIELEPERAANFALKLRIPSWCSAPALSANGEPVRDLQPGNYASVQRNWKAGDRVELTLPMTTRWVKGAHSNEGLVALERGPVVFALDGIWQKEAISEIMAGDRKHDNMPGVKSVGGELRPAAVPAGALGPAYEADVVLADGQKVSAVMLPYANLGKWYRTANEKEAVLQEASTQTGGDPRRPKALKGKQTPYAVWLPPAVKA